MGAAAKPFSYGDIKHLLFEAWNEWNKDNAPRLGASLAYYTILSIAPLLVVVIGIAGLVFGQEAAQGQIFYQIRGLVGDQGAEAIQTMIKNAGKMGQGITATILGIGALLFGATSVVAELRSTLNAVWNVPPNPNGGFKDLLKDRSYAVAVVLACGFLLLVSLVLSAVTAAMGKILGGWLPMPEALLTAVNMVISFVVVTGVFALIFKLLPDVEIAWRDVFLGAVFTSFLFTLGKFAIGLYLGKASFGSTYGAAGSLVIVLVWVYYSAQILFFGAEFTQVYAREHGSNPQRDHGADRETRPSPPSAEYASSAARGNAVLEPGKPRSGRSRGMLLAGAMLAGVFGAAANGIRGAFRRQA